MYERVLFPTDGSDAATSVLEYALDVASAHDATMSVLYVADTMRDSVTRIEGDVVDALEREGEGVVESAANRARNRGVSVESDVLQGEPYSAIVDYGEQRDVDLIVMPTHGRKRLKRVLLGSVTERVVNSADAPVLTVTPDGDRTFEYPCSDVLVPTDGSRGADAGLRAGIDLAHATGAGLHLLHVVETAALGLDVRSAIADDALEERANEILSAASDTARESGVDEVTTTVEYGRAYREIRDYVPENDVDVVALGTQGKTDFSRFSLGGVSSKLLRSAPVPVLLSRAPADSG